MTSHNWLEAHRLAAEMLTLPEEASEEEMRTRVYMALRQLFPDIGYPELKLESQSGSGPTDIKYQEVILEVKAKGKQYATHLYNGKDETPRQQLLRYFRARRVTNRGIGQMTVPGMELAWRGVITDGIHWDFYEYDQVHDHLIEKRKMYLRWEGHLDELLQCLHDFISGDYQSQDPAWQTSTQ